MPSLRLIEKTPSTMSKILLSLAMLLSLLSCQKPVCDCLPPNITDAEKIVFGVSYAECAGDCSRNYQLTTTQLFADNCDYCLISEIGFQTTSLEDAKFQIAKPLFDLIPTALLNATETVYGCPGCRDEGAYLLEITQNGTTHLYRWSDDFTDVPEELRSYFEKVMQTLRDL